MSVGGFVIHGNNAPSLRGCLADLREAFDAVVVVDSGSTDGSAAVAESLGVRRVEFPDCEWIFFLDTDERLSAGSIELVRRIAASGEAAAFRCTVRDWAGTGEDRFWYRSHHRIRLLQREHCGWAPHMVVHESSGAERASTASGIVIDHDFAPDLRQRLREHELYAWLWAVRAHNEARCMKSPALQRAFHLFKDADVEGAAFRGGLAGLTLAWRVSDYHALKYRFLAALRRGEAAALPELHRLGQFSALFSAVRQFAAE